MDPQLLARLQQMLGGGAPPPAMGGGMAGFGGPASGGSSQFSGSPWSQPPTNAQPMPAPPGGGMNMPMGAPSGGWPLGLAQQSGGRPPNPPDGRPPLPIDAPPPTPGTGGIPKPKPAAKPVAGPGDKDFDMNKYLQSFVGKGITQGDYMSAMHYGGDTMMRLFDIARRLPGQPQAAAPTPTPKPPKPNPPGAGRPPPNPNPGQQGAPSGFPAQTVGVNPIITPMFRHLFSDADVAKYGIRQPNVISNATYDDKGLHWQTGTQKKWWEPNNPIEWQKDKKG